MSTTGALNTVLRVPAAHLPYISYTNQRLHTSIDSCPSCTQFKSSISAQQNAIRCCCRVRPGAMPSDISLLLLLLLLLRASYTVRFATNNTQVEGSGQSQCSQLNSAIDGLSDGSKQRIFPTIQLDFAIFPRATCHVQNGVPRLSSVHSERPRYSSSIPLPFCGTLETKQRRRKAQEEEISLRSFLRNAILLTSTLCKFARSGQEIIEGISKTIAGSDRKWALDWFSFVLISVETKEVVDRRQ